MAKYNKDGEPVWIRCYDNDGKTADRYTVVFTRKRTCGQFMFLGMSEWPTHPQGFGQHDYSDDQIDRPKYGHLGRKIKFSDLPKECRDLVMQDYALLWGKPPKD